MHVPLNDPKREYLAVQEECDGAISRVIESGYYIMGSEVQSFVEEFASYCKCQYAVAVANGTDALEIALRALDCGPGDEVVTVANAGMYTTTACVQVGATPVFADIEKETLLISPHSADSVVTDRTKVIVVTHLFGKLADIDGIREAILPRQIAILEDCSQAHGAERNGRKAGSFGDLATFSFYPTKNLGALGDAGAVVTDQMDVFERVQRLRQYGWSERFHASMPYGRNSRMDEFQAACLRVKLPRLDEWNQKRRAIVEQYRDACVGQAFTLVHEESSDYVAHLCIVRHPDREKFRVRMHEHGIATAIHYPVPDHHQRAMQSIPWKSGELNVTMDAQQEILTLPCFPHLTDKEVEYVCRILKQVG